ncbi:hypothetical protein ACQH7H_23370, partial [Escherichia coli]|uniref:coiled-coil domain-containing protein n=1 Tax=Escherichia coli TaxID=562 RepID=UPI003CEE908B
NKPVLTYEASIATLERITGYEGQKVRIGDQVLVIDKTFKPAILLEARVVELQRSFTNPLDDAVKLGEYRPIKPSLSKLVGKLDSSMSNTVKYPDLPKIQQDFTDEVIKPIKNVVGELEEEVEETVQAVVNIDGLMKEVQDKVKAVEEDVKEREVKIYRQPTPPTNVPVDTLWINTDKNIMYRWDGKTWIELAPDLEGVQEEINKAFDELDGKITSESEKIDEAIKQTEQKVTDLQSDLADKVDANWVNGQLVSKANVGDSYTKKESDNALNGKVSTTTYTTDKNGIINRLDSAETRVTQAEDKIKLTATKDELKQSSDGLTSKINKINTDLTVQAGLIEGKVSTTTYTTDKTANETRFKNAESRIAQTEKDITAKVNSTDVYKKTEIDPKLNAKVDTTTYNSKIASIEATNKSITQRVEEVNKTVTGLSVGGRNLVFDTMFANGTKYWTGLTSGTVVDVTGVPNVKKGLRLTSNTTFITQVMDITPFKENTKGYMSGYVKVDALTAGTEFPRIYLRFTFNQNGTDKLFYVIVSQKTTTDGFVRLSAPFDLTKYEGTLKDVRMNFATANTTTVDATFAGIMVMFGDFVTSFVQAPEDFDAQLDAKVNAEDYNKKVAEIKVTTDKITQTVSDVSKTVTSQGTR